MTHTSPLERLQNLLADKLNDVNTLIEMTDMREAQRSYEANLNVIKASKAMLNETIEVLR